MKTLFSVSELHNYKAAFLYSDSLVLIKTSVCCRGYAATIQPKNSVIVIESYCHWLYKVSCGKMIRAQLMAVSLPAWLSVWGEVQICTCPS